MKHWLIEFLIELFTYLFTKFLLVIGLLTVGGLIMEKVQTSEVILDHMALSAFMVTGFFILNAHTWMEKMNKIRNEYLRTQIKRQYLNL